MAPSGFEVVARYANGDIQRGETWDFRPERAWFQMRVAGSDEPVRVLIEELKAVFFVKSLDGNSLRDDTKEFAGPERVGRKTWVEFADGEQIAGWVESLTEFANGFFLLPADPQSNNEKVFVSRRAVVGLLHDADAERAARQHDQRTASEGVRHSNELWKAFLGEAPRPKAPQPPKKRPPSRAGSGHFLQDF
jgi:hypothetical protein